MNSADWDEGFQKEQRSKAGSWKRTDDRPPVASPVEPTHYVKDRWSQIQTDDHPQASPVEPSHHVSILEPSF